jgi:hypothetical protein
MAIIITKNGRNAKKIDKQPFEYENNLQKYIDDNPLSIPLYEIKEDIKVLILAREFSTDSGPIDALGIDTDGDIYIIETKLYKNADKRTVVAQALDYGASLWKSSIEFGEFINATDKYLQNKEFKNTKEKIVHEFGFDENQTELLLERIKENLNHGNFKFIILMDQIDDRLKDLILFVNENSKFDIYAVQFDFYKHEDNEIIIPKLFGAQVKKDIGVKTSSTRQRWDEISFFQKAKETVDQNVFREIREMYDYFCQKGRVEWGSGSVSGSINFLIPSISSKRSILTLWTNGPMQINLNWLNDSQTALSFRKKLWEKLQDKEGLLLPKILDENYAKQPVIKTEDWIKNKEVIKRAIEEALGEIE